MKIKRIHKTTKVGWELNMVERNQRSNRAEAAGNSLVKKKTAKFAISFKRFRYPLCVDGLRSGYYIPVNSLFFILMVTIFAPKFAHFGSFIARCSSYFFVLSEWKMVFISHGFLRNIRFTLAGRDMRCVIIIY